MALSRSRSHLIPIVALGVVAAGCANTGLAPRQSTSVSPTAAATLSPGQTPGPTPPEFPSVGPGAAGLKCRLPVTFETGYTSDALTYNAFVEFPQGRVTSATSFPYGQGFSTYVHSANRWLPVGWGSILPDESEYLTMDGDQQPPYTTRLHLFEITSGHERVVQVPPPDGAPRYGYALRQYTAEGLYVARAVMASEDSGEGLSLLDTNGGNRRELTPFGYWPIIAGGAAWGYTNDDTVAPPPDGYAAFNSVVRLDLHTGQRQVWLVTPGRRIDIAGVDDAGRLLVMVSNGSSLRGFTPASSAELRLISTPGQWRTYPVPASPSHDGLITTFFTGITDASGIWVTDIDAIYLFDPEHGLLRILAGRYGLTVAGRCT